MKYAQLHFSTPRLPIQFISMDLIDPFDPSSNGYHFDGDMYVNRMHILCLLENQGWKWGSPSIHG